MTGLTWNYRMFHRTVSDGAGGTEDEWTIREAYYEDDSDEVSSWTVAPCFPSGETKDDLMKDLALMSEALSQPVIEITRDGHRRA